LHGTIDFSRRRKVTPLPVDGINLPSRIILLRTFSARLPVSLLPLPFAITRFSGHLACRPEHLVGCGTQISKPPTFLVGLPRYLASLPVYLACLRRHLNRLKIFI
jgi:hypothetical protein